MRVLLHDNQLCERGTTTAMTDYARVLRARGHDIGISYWSDSPANVASVVSRLGEEFTLVPHKVWNTPPKVSEDYDSAYFIKAGTIDGLTLPGRHNLVHAVFQNYNPHGSRYVYVSQWLAEAMRTRSLKDREARAATMSLADAAARAGCLNTLEFEHLNHIVDTPTPQSGIREELGIPEDAFVILRFGGYETFDIGWVKDTVVQALDAHPHWHFLGLNTEVFTDHPRAHFLPMIIDPVEKVSVISASNVFLSARSQGESFGLAIAEALQVGIPVLAWAGGHDRNHLSMLNGLGGLYRRPLDLRWRLGRLAAGRDPSSQTARRTRGDQFRPAVVAPKLELLLTPHLMEPE